MKHKSIVTATWVAVVLLLLACIYTGCDTDVAEAEVRLLLVEPYITQHPLSAAYQVTASAIDPLEVLVGEWNPGDGAISFQWYKFNTIADYLEDKATAIPGANGASYTPALADLKTTAGAKNYFYAVVTNSNFAATNRQSASVQSDVAVISFYSGAKPPVITRQPSGEQARFGRSLNPLSVKVDVPAAGALSYQWYQVKRVYDNGVPTQAFETNVDGTPVGAKLIARIVQVLKDEDEWDDPDVPEYEDEIIWEEANEYEPTYVRDDSAVPAGAAFPAILLNKNYFYVEVTYTPTSGTPATETSVPALIDILPGLRAEAPIITTQPVPALYFPSESTIAPLTVAGDSPDFGTLSYQWYSNSTGSSKTGTPVSNATGASYTPELGAGEGGAFYFVVVTNTNPNVIGATTASTNSRAVNVRRATAASPSPNSTIVIGELNDPDNNYNYVRGYGGMEVAWANFPETLPADTELQYDPDRLGYNILRIMMPVTDVNIDKAMDYLVNETKRRPHYYENVKIVNKYGGYVAAAPWSPPKEWKSNNSINGGGILRYEYYKQYAAYLKAFAQHMYNRGAPIYCISIQNEPNYTAGYDGCEWTGIEMRDFFKEVGVFTQGVRGYGGGKQIPRVLTMNGESANNPNINWPAIDDPVAYAAIDVFARHVYGERTQNLWNSRPNVQKLDKKEVWMTEHNINSANASGYYLDSSWDYIWRFMNDIDLVMRRNNENAFVWWASKRFYSMVGDGQYGTPNGEALPRGWGLAHYSRYTIDTTRVGFTMTGTTVGGAAISFSNDATNGAVLNGSTGDMDNTTARITAYKSQDGKEISLVMWTPTLQDGDVVHNLGTIKIDMPTGFLIAGATSVRSRKVSATANEYLVPQDVGVSADRKSAYVTLNGSQILSVKITKQ